MILKNLTRYPALLDGSREATHPGNKARGRSVKGSKSCDSVGCHPKTTLGVWKMKHHVTPSLVLRAPCPAIVVSPFAHEGVSDLYINMLLLQYILVFKQDMTIDILQTPCLTETQKLIVNKTISERIQLVNVLKIILAFVPHEVLHKIVRTNMEKLTVHIA